MKRRRGGTGGDRDAEMKLLTERRPSKSEEGEEERVGKKDGE